MNIHEEHDELIICFPTLISFLDFIYVETIPGFYFVRVWFLFSS